MSTEVTPARLVISGRRHDGYVGAGSGRLLMLGSNDYLGLSTDERVLAATCAAIRDYGAGSCIYPIFADTELHETLCRELASFLGTEAALLFASGTAANAGVLTALTGEGDVIFSDRLNHASIIDGCRSSRARTLLYDNRDVDDLRFQLEHAGICRRRLIVTDGIFSMEGGAAPLREIHALACEFDALLVVDEAHATGVVGPSGRGTLPLQGIGNGASRVLLTGSFSKALGGASGGFVAGPGELVASLRASRSWTFTMGMTTANVATALTALRIITRDETPLFKLWSNIALLKAALGENGVEAIDGNSAIFAISAGAEDEAQALSRTLLDNDIFAPAIAYPVVPLGEGRLRLQVSAAHEPHDLRRAASILKKAMHLAVNGQRQAHPCDQHQTPARSTSSLHTRSRRKHP